MRGKRRRDINIFFIYLETWRKNFSEAFCCNVSMKTILKCDMNHLRCTTQEKKFNLTTFLKTTYQRKINFSEKKLNSKEKHSFQGKRLWLKCQEYNKTHWRNRQGNKVTEKYKTSLDNTWLQTDCKRGNRKPPDNIDTQQQMTSSTFPCAGYVKKTKSV